jgi:tetratricopeptide (TPR) repeat protein
MNKISDPQYGDNFVGRGAENKELKEKIENNGIVVITGDRGIGKTNLTLVVEKATKEEKAWVFLKKRKCYHVDGALFYEDMNRIFMPDKISTGASSSVSILGFGAGVGKNWKPREPSVLEYMEESKEKIIFVENAHELKEEEIETIFAGSRRNDQLKFVLEIATPYMGDVKLRAGSYEVVELKELSAESIGKIVRKCCPNFSDAIVNGIVQHSKGYPYVARSLAYICDKKNDEEEMFKFLNTLSYDDMKFNLGKIHKEVLETFDKESQEVIKKLAIAPATLTLKLIEAFCGEEVDAPLNDTIERGILVESEEKFYQIYHLLFREYLRHIQPIALKNKKEIYCEAIEEVKSEFDSFFILLEVINEPDIFKELIKRTENYGVINSIGSQAYKWGELEQALCAWKHMLERTKDKDKEVEAIARGNIGLVYKIKGELDKALEYYGKAWKLNEELGRREGMAIGLGNIGIVYRIKGELDKALEYYEKAWKLNEELGRKEGMAADLGNIGNVYRIKGELDKALEYLKKALKLNEELGRREGRANQLGNIGIVYQIKGELDKALEYYGKALKLDEELGSKEGMANQLGNIGNVYRIKGELDKALEYYGKAWKLDEELGSKEGLAADLVNIGTVHQNKGELDKALEYYGKAWKLDEALGSKEGMAADLVNIGTVHRIKGELDKALEYYGKALELDEELGSKEGLAADLVNIGNVYQNKGELDNALEYYENALKKFKDIGNRIENARTLMNLGDIFVQKGDKERALNYYLEAQDLAKGSSVFEDVRKRLNRLKEEQNA